MLIKKTIIGWISLFFILFFIPNTTYADEAIITTNQLNIRGGPGTDFDIIGQADTDETFPIVTTQNDWVQIQLGDQTGWVLNEYISIEHASGEQTDTGKQKSEKKNEPPSSIVIQFDHTQVRQGPSTDEEIIYFADKNTKYDVISKEGSWYEISDGDVNGYVFKELVQQNQAAEAPGLKNKTIVIDAGHGGQDVGAIGATGVYEKDVVDLTAKHLEQELSMLGMDVYITRPEDKFVSLASRSALSNVMETDAFISLHYNSVPEMPNVSGVETYYYSEQNNQLANYVQQEIIKETDSTDRGATQGDFAVLRQNFKPAILIELGFISNKEDEALLYTNAYQQKIVSGIANGLRKYFTH